MVSSQALIYLGPSLGHDKARKLLPQAEYLPPAKKGDFLALTTKRRDTHNRLVVGLVDGVFMQDYPPTPIEVFQLIKQPNVVLAGAASLGALRAVELEKFGMIGIGRVFRLFKTGKLDADDEVAVTFSEGDYHLLSEAMIDIRYNLYLAHKSGIIGKETKSAITAVSKKIYFPHRNYPDILSEVSRLYPSLVEEIDSFGKYIHSNRKSLKEKDAMRMLIYVRSILNKYG